MLTERLLGNSIYFTEYEIRSSQLYFKHRCIKAPIKTCIDSGTSSRGSISRESFPYHCAFNLAEHLGTEFAEFPGHHVGYNTVHHKEFAERLHDIIEN